MFFNPKLLEVAARYVGPAFQQVIGRVGDQYFAALAGQHGTAIAGAAAAEGAKEEEDAP